MIKFFIKKSVVTISLNLSILFIGYFALNQISNEFIPAIEIPAVAIIFPTTILSHEKIIEELIEPVEKKLLASGLVEKLETSLDKDKTIVLAHFKWDLKPEECLQNARQLVSGQKLPQGVLNPLFVLHRPTLAPIYRVALYGESIGELTKNVKSLTQEVERTKGVAQVKLLGSAPVSGLIELSPLGAAESKSTVLDIIKNAYQKWSFRYFYKGEYINNYIQIGIKEISDVENLPISDGKKTIPLRRIAQVRETVPAAEVYFGKAEEALVLEVIKAPGSDALLIVDKVFEQIEKLKQKNKSIKSVVVYDEAQKIRDAQAGVLQNFVSGVILNSFILLIFLGSTVGSLVASCIFPPALLGTFFIMKEFGISLNIFALNGFSLGSGMITDASIVALESIMRRFQNNEDLISACWKGSKDVLLGIICATITSAGVILPICLQTGVSAKLFSDLGFVLVATQFIALIPVFSLVPWLCSKTLKKEEKPLPFVGIMFKMTSYLVKIVSEFSKKCLDKSVTNKVFKYALPGSVTVLSLSLLFFIPESEFLPQVASQVFSYSIPIKRSELSTIVKESKQKLALKLGENEKIKWVLTLSDSDTINGLFELKNSNDLNEVLNQIASVLNVLESNIIALPVGPAPSSEPLGHDGYFYISSSLEQKTKDSIKKEFCEDKGVYLCTTENHYYESKLNVITNSLNLARFSTNTLESTLNLSAMTNDLDMTSIANLPLSYSAFLRIPKFEILTEFPFISGKTRENITSFGSLFDKELSANSSAHFRKDNKDYQPLYFRLKNFTLGQALSLMEKIKAKHKLDSKSVVTLGALETMEETFSKMTFALSISALIIFLVLLLQFKSLIQTLIVMYSIPLAVGGSILGLVLLKETFNVGVIVGFILLIGIVVNNGILLIEAINQKVDQGLSFHDAIVDAISSRTRPILITAFCTIFGMMPTLIFDSEGSELYRGMAIVNIFGMFIGTFLTLLVTPILIRTFVKLKET